MGRKNERIAELESRVEVLEGLVKILQASGSTYPQIYPSTYPPSPYIYPTVTTGVGYQCPICNTWNCGKTHITCS